MAAFLERATSMQSYKTKFPTLFHMFSDIERYSIAPGQKWKCFGRKVQEIHGLPAKS